MSTKTKYCVANHSTVMTHNFYEAT